jgi:translation initiation factor 2 gamma subunit (eIF-2gamma)
MKIGIVGHIDHGKTALTADIQSVIANKGLHEQKTIDEITEDENSIKIYSRPEYNLTSFDIKDGKKSRRERRAKERNGNKNHKR